MLRLLILMGGHVPLEEALTLGLMNQEPLPALGHGNAMRNLGALDCDESSIVNTTL